MPTLEWIGKSKVVNHHLDVPYHVLDRKYSFDESGQHEEDDGSENMIIHGDNLLALKSLLPQYEGRIDCIYIDPPYATGNDWIYNDKVDDPIMRKWLGAVVGAEGEDLSRHDKWLCMMYPRMRLLKRLLAPNGVFFVSIDDDELANLLLLVKEVFGNPNAVFVWKSRSKPTNAGNAKFRPQKVSEYIIMYTQDKNRVFNVGEKEDDYSYPNEDEFGKFRTSTILTSNFGTYQRETMRFEVAGYTPPADKRWKAGIDTIQGLWNNHRLLFTADGSPMEKIYEQDNESVVTPLYTLIDSEISGTTESGKTELNSIIGSGHGFDTVKPVGLIQYLISVCTDSNSIILDSFAGTGTTAQATICLNKIDNGNRKFILIEMMDYADSITAERIKRVITGYSKDEESVLYDEEITAKNLSKGAEILDRAKGTVKEAKDSGEYSTVKQPKIEDGHLRVVAIKKAKDQEPGIPGSFSYYELGEPLLKDGLLNETVGVDKIREYVFFTETKQKIAPCKADEPYFLGQHAGNAYYFYYQRECLTTLDRDFLHTVKTKSTGYVIYADLCTLSDRELEQYHITFKKIPRDISRL